MHDIEWESLLKGAQKGEKECETELITLLRVRFHQILRYRLYGWSVQDREDILEEALGDFWVKLESGNVKCTPQVYAHRILLNIVNREIKRKLKRREISLNEDVRMDYNEEKSAADESERSEIAELIKVEIMNMSRFCQAFFLIILEDRKIKDVWELFLRKEPNLTRSAFDLRTRRCRQRLKLSLEGRGVL